MDASVRRRRALWWRRREAQRQCRRMWTLALAAMIVTSTMWVHPRQAGASEQGAPATACAARYVTTIQRSRNAHDLVGCYGAWQWPVTGAMLREFSGPPQPWLAGHRGVDIAVRPGAALIAPASGMLRFAGMVAGKNVVSLDHDGVVSTFEPAVSTLPVGAPVRMGQQFAVVQGQSDHCADSCVHWGVMLGKGAYLDPVSRIRGGAIRLKPLP